MPICCQLLPLSISYLSVMLPYFNIRWKKFVFDTAALTSIDEYYLAIVHLKLKYPTIQCRFSPDSLHMVYINNWYHLGVLAPSIGYLIWQCLFSRNTSPVYISHSTGVPYLPCTSQYSTPTVSSHSVCSLLYIWQCLTCLVCYTVGLLHLSDIHH